MGWNRTIVYIHTYDIVRQVHLHGYHLDVLEQVGRLLKHVLKECDLVALNVNLEDVDDTVHVAEAGEDVGVAVHLRARA